MIVFVVKLKQPLLSFLASGRLAEILAFRRRFGKTITEKKPVPPDARSLTQLSWRHMYQKAVALWHALSAAEKQDWESQARSRHMTGFAWFMSQALKPNPGLYLPLQGGTMSGNIDMAKNRLLQLPVPVGVQDPLRVAEFNSSIYPYLYHEGARVYHSANQSIPTGAWTTLIFDSERWDTDAIHDPITNNDRLTCKTAGRYLIAATIMFATNNVGSRGVAIYSSDGFYIAMVNANATQDDPHNFTISTIWDMSVGDYVILQVVQKSGAPLNILAETAYSSEFMMERIGV